MPVTNLSQRIVTINCETPLSLFWRANFSVMRRGASPERLSQSGQDRACSRRHPLGRDREFVVCDAGEISTRPSAPHVQRLGGHTSIHVDVRVITATNVLLKDLVAASNIRSDLYKLISNFSKRVRHDLGHIILLPTSLPPTSPNTF